MFENPHRAPHPIEGDAEAPVVPALRFCRPQILTQAELPPPAVAPGGDRPLLGVATEIEALRRGCEVEPPAIDPGPWAEPVAAGRRGFRLLARAQAVER